MTLQELQDLTTRNDALLEEYKRMKSMNIEQLETLLLEVQEMVGSWRSISTPTFQTRSTAKTWEIRVTDIRARLNYKRRVNKQSNQTKLLKAVQSGIVLGRVLEQKKQASLKAPPVTPEHTVTTQDGRTLYGAAASSYNPNKRRGPLLDENGIPIPEGLKGAALSNKLASKKNSEDLSEIESAYLEHKRQQAQPSNSEAANNLLDILSNHISAQQQVEQFLKNDPNKE